MTVSNPYNAVISDARNLLSTLAEHALQLHLALESRHYAQQAWVQAKRNYEADEAEFLADYTYTDEMYGSAKNEKQREVLRDAALVKSRTVGVLAHPWRVLNDCRLAYDNAELGFAQCETQYKATRVAADLMSAMLRAASV